MSPLLRPRPESTSAKIGTSISTPLVVPVVSRTWVDCAKPTTATSRISRPRFARPAPQNGALGWLRSQVLLERLVVGVRLARWAEVGDVLQPELPLLALLPHRLDPQPHPDLLGRAVEDEVQERDVGPVEQDVG